MSQTWTKSRRPGTVPMDDMDEQQRDDKRDLVWSRFWLGIGCVLAFMIISILLVTAVGGVEAGKVYGLTVLIVTMIAGTVDGIILYRRRR
jgi:hypothetical protein